MSFRPSRVGCWGRWVFCMANTGPYWWWFDCKPTFSKLCSLLCGCSSHKIWVQPSLPPSPPASMVPRLLELVISSWVVCSQRTPRTPRGLVQSKDNSNRHRKPPPGTPLTEINTAHHLGARGCLCPPPQASACGAREGSRAQITRAKTQRCSLCLAQAQGPPYPLCTQICPWHKCLIGGRASFPSFLSTTNATFSHVPLNDWGGQNS